jgi:hypothetical protein
MNEKERTTESNAAIIRPRLAQGEVSLLAGSLPKTFYTSDDENGTQLRKERKRKLKGKEEEIK